MTTKSPSILLDANVVIELFQRGLWGAVCGRCPTIVTETVVQEAIYYDVSPEEQARIDLEAEARAGCLTIVAASAAEVKAFASPLGLGILDKLDPGEAESLAWQSSIGSTAKICSADKIVWRVLGFLKRPEDGISLEEVLGAIGRTCALERHFTRAYREHWTRTGFVEGL